MSAKSTSSKIDSDVREQSITTLSSIIQAVNKSVASLYLAFGKLVTAIGTAFTAIARRMSVTMLRRQPASQPFSGYMARRLIGSLHANRVTLYMPGMERILACFKWVNPSDLDMDSRGAHMFNPNQHIVISLTLDAIGRPGYVSRDKWYQCMTSL